MRVARVDLEAIQRRLALQLLRDVQKSEESEPFRRRHPRGPGGKAQNGFSTRKPGPAPNAGRMEYIITLSYYSIV